MYVSLVDAGTFGRGGCCAILAKTIVSSADLVSRFEAVLKPEQIASHYQAQKRLDEILAAAWKEMGARVRPPREVQGRAAGGANEYDMAVWLQEAMRRAGLVWESGPNVSVNANTSDSHYEATTSNAKPIRNGDFVLIDIWARMDQPDSCFYDITWTGVVGRSPSDRERQVFETVAQARDATVILVEQAFRVHQPLPGWQADDAARKVIREAGFAQYFTHRTGPQHRYGSARQRRFHLDNLETHDERLLLPYTCFSVEPGIYLPEFGVRSEVNVITRPGKAEVTGRVQRELVQI